MLIFGRQTGDILAIAYLQYAHPQVHSYTLFMCIHVQGSHGLPLGGVREGVGCVVWGGGVCMYTYFNHTKLLYICGIKHAELLTDCH